MNSRWTYPVSAAKSRRLIDSFNRKIIPGSRPPRPYRRGKHGAIDIPWTEGSKVILPRDAVVIARGVIKGLEALGNQVLLRWKRSDGKFRYLRLCHFKSIGLGVKVGKVLKRGAYLGRLGKSGQTKGPHVHLELSSSPRWSDVSALINPHELLEEARLAA